MILTGVISVAVIITCIFFYIKTRKKASYMSFKASSDLVGLPIITFYSNNNKLHFLLDTGADHSAFSKDYLNLVENYPVSGTGTLTDAGGNTVEVGFSYIILEYDDKIYKNTFQLVDMEPISEAIDLQVKGTKVKIMGIIGDDFLAKYKYILDFQKMVAYSKL